MQGSIDNGDVLFVDSSVREYDGDGIYVISREDDLQVKRLQRMTDGLAIISDNPAFRDEKITPADAEHLVIWGRVMAVWSLRKLW